MAKADEKRKRWDESVIEDERIALAAGVVVRSITDLVTPAKILTDNLYFEGLDILRCYEGRFRFSFEDGKSLTLNPGEILLIFPRHFVTIKALDSSNRIVYGIFGGFGVEDYFGSMGYYDRLVGRTSAHYESIRRLREMFERRGKMTEEEHYSAMSYLSDVLGSQIVEIKSAENGLVFRAVKAIHGNLRRGIVRLDPLCETLGVSRSHLHKVFKENGLGSPSDFIRNAQLRKVIALMADTQLTIHEIIAQAGFLSQSHFATFIRRMTGMTPTELRHRYRIDYP